MACAFVHAPQSKLYRARDVNWRNIAIKIPEQTTQAFVPSPDYVYQLASPLREGARAPGLDSLQSKMREIEEP